MLCLPKCHFYKTTTSFNLGSQLFNVLLINFQVVNIVTSNQDCVNNIAESLVLSNLLALLHSLPSSEYVHRWAWSSEHVHRWVWSSMCTDGRGQVSMYTDGRGNHSLTAPGDSNLQLTQSKCHPCGVLEYLK